MQIGKDLNHVILKHFTYTSFSYSISKFAIIIFKCTVHEQAQTEPATFYNFVILGSLYGCNIQTV